VVFSTVIGYVFIQIPWEAHVVFTEFFNGGQARAYWRMHAGFALLALALCTVTWGAARLVPLDGIGGLAVQGAVAAVVSCSALLALFRKEAPAMLKALRKGRANR
jgi:hypothetical protein